MGKRYASKTTLQSLMGVFKTKFDVLKKFDETLLNSLEDKVYGTCAPDGEAAKWSYTLDEDNHSIVLQQYTGSDTSVIVYSNYFIDGKKYLTKIGSNDTNNTSSYMFTNNTNITSITFNEGVDTSNNTNISYMFNECNSLTTINGLENLNTSKVTTMYRMFRNCNKLTSLDLHTWNTSNVTYMDQMFQFCSSLTSLDLSSFDVSNIDNMRMMFHDCSSLTSLDLRNWDISKCTDMNYIFNACTNLKEIKATNGKWVIPSGCSTTGMFGGCGVSSVTYYD